MIDRPPSRRCVVWGRLALAKRIIDWRHFVNLLCRMVDTIFSALRRGGALCSATQIIDLRRIRLLLLYIKVRTAWGVTGDTVSKNQRFVALRVLDDGISPAGYGPRD